MLTYLLVNLFNLENGYFFLRFMGSQIKKALTWNGNLVNETDTSG